MSQENDWIEYKQLVLANQKRTEDKVDKAIDQINNIKTALATMQVKVAIGVFIVSSITGIIIKNIIG